MIFFFYGPNTYASRRKLQQMVATYRQKTGGNLGLERIDGAQTTARQLTSMLQATPFLASSRLVIIEGLAGNKPAAEAAVKLLPHIPDTTVAVFYEGEADQRTVFFKAMTADAKVKAIKFELLNPSQLHTWIRREVEKLGGSIERPALALLLDRAGEDQWRLEQEVTKLINYDPAITVQTIEKLVADSQTQDIFDLVEAIAVQNLKRSLAIFHNLVSDQTNEIYILSMIIWQLRNLLLAKTAGAMTPPELAKRAGMSPYVAQKVLAKQRAFEETTLKRAFLEAVETDYAIKSGQGEAEQLVEHLIYRLATA